MRPSSPNTPVLLEVTFSQWQALEMEGGHLVFRTQMEAELDEVDAI